MVVLLDTRFATWPLGDGEPFHSGRRQSRAEQSRAEQSRAEQSRAEQSR